MTGERTLTIVRNDRDVPAGHVERVAVEHDIPLDHVLLDEGDAFPDPREVDAAVVLGGAMGAYDTDTVPYLEREKEFLRALLEEEVPVLGLCLGCQLLADALGGSAYLADRPEVVFAAMNVVEDDPVVSVLASHRSLAMHRDTWDLPPGGRMVGHTVGYNGAFRLGSALGVQPHPEVDGDSITHWLTYPSGVAMAVEAGADAEATLAEYRAASEEVTAAADSMFTAWFREAGLLDS